MGMNEDGRALAEAIQDVVVSGVRVGRNNRVPNADDLSGVLLVTITGRLDEAAPRRDVRFDKQIAWQLLRLAITRTGDAPEAERPLLVAASHLIAAGRNPAAPDRPAPYSDLSALARSVGISPQALLKAANVQSGAEYRSSASLRQAYAARASRLGTNRDAVRPGQTSTGRAISPAIAASLRRTLDDTVTLQRVIAEATAAGLPILPDPQERPHALTEAQGALPAPRWTKPFLWAGGAAVLVAVVTTGILLSNGITGAAEGAAEASAPIATIESVASKPPRWTINTAFWVPASAPLEELEAATDGCADPAAREWLQKHGVYRDAFYFTVRNVSGDTIGLTEVASRGTVSPAKPGLIVKCSGGGEGGGIDWTVLALDIDEDAVATLKNTSQVSDYFWSDMPKGETSGIMVVPSGEHDFTGTLTADVIPTGGSSSRLIVPALEGGGDRKIDWHGMPSDKTVVYTLPSPDDEPLCTVNGSALPSCSVASLRTALGDLWGDQ
ncbi:hypothetical protein BOH66_08415 [Microbacterium aurum]|uniref:Uncharacterized protein n=1 Tax=Microbacterium aurum TaxID=36805 RepID=A0A1P8U838_9MICO|nr:hypothetical protein [Microbacterium aurum]APZ34263.1 hypothetical protein BOH66_08415 [Microbacterium aurum]MBM7828102.1 hypothetical protein [Microbacterium aurum]